MIGKFVDVVYYGFCYVVIFYCSYFVEINKFYKLMIEVR